MPQKNISLVAVLLISNLCFSQLPLQPARTISFTTDEGSYMSVDVSPDGKTLAFDLLGDLYTVPATGGTATQITRGLALKLRPVWSPDGKRIAYVSDYSGSYRVNVMNADGTAHRVFMQSEMGVYYGQSLRWSADGNYVCYGASAYGIAGGVFKLPANNGWLLNIAADGSAIYMATDTLYRYNKHTDVKKIISIIPKKAVDGQLSPNDQLWAYRVDSNGIRSLIIKDLVSQKETVLVTSLFKDWNYRPYMPSARFSFSPDSKYIYISYGGKIHRLSTSGGRDEVIPFQANVKSDLGPLNYNTFRVSHDSVKVRYARSASMSPDGKHLLFSTLNKVYVKDLPNSKPHIVAEQNANQYQPSYSPDGKWIAYVSWNDNEGGYVWRVPATGGEPEQLTKVAGQYQRPVWSPDGQKIAVIAGDARLGDRDDRGNGQLILVTIATGEITVIDESVPMWNQLSFSADGKKINYQPHGGEFNKRRVYIESRDLRGADSRPVAIGADRFGLIIEHRSYSPGGRFLLYSAGEDLYLVPATMLGGPETLYETEGKSPIIRFASGVDPYWADNGKTLCWTYGNQFHRVAPDKIIATAEKKMLSNQELFLGGESEFITAAVVPDKTINIDVSAEALHGKGIIAFRDVRLITMKGKQVIEHGTIVIKDGRILSVGPMAATVIPQGAKVNDMAGATIMPGLVDLHLHSRIPPNIFPQQSWMYLASLAYGVTSSCDPSLSYDSYGYSELLRAGKMIGPRLYSVGRAARFYDGISLLDNDEDARSIVNKRFSLGGTVIKQYDLPTRLQRQRLLQACLQQGINMTNEGNFDALEVIGMIKDGSTGVEHNPVWGDIYKDVISFIAQSRTCITPALQACYGNFDDYSIENARDYFNYKYWSDPDDKLKRFTDSSALKKLLVSRPKDIDDPGFLIPARIDTRIFKSGGRIGMGSHGNDKGAGPHNEIWALQMGGFSNWEALHAATLVGAEALGIQKDLGSLEPGKIADLIILNKNPLEDIHNTREIKWVMKDGILYNGDTLDQLWPVYKKCPEWRMQIK